MLLLMPLLILLVLLPMLLMLLLMLPLMLLVPLVLLLMSPLVLLRMLLLLLVTLLVLLMLLLLLLVAYGVVKRQSDGLSRINLNAKGKTVTKETQKSVTARCIEAIRITPAPEDKMSLRDFQDVEAVEIQVSTDGNRIWVCIDGGCVLRVKGITEPVEIQDDREE